MIGYIEGLLMIKQPPHLLINVNGIGYEIEAPMTVFYDLPASGDNVSLHTHLQVREDAHKLYGFVSIRQRDLFRALLKVNGVGPRVALAILSGLSVQAFESCIAEGDIGQLTRVPGIGRKTAERLLVEMRDRLDDLGEPDSSDPSSRDHSEQDAIGALIALGYKQPEAMRAVRGIRAAGMSSEALIKEALAALATVKA
ncbi:MAG: Holliday junction ATP-dependent DNA helicase RuvA [marine bacterium B5-7]|nr:MAG: Holliday junction ATP-dependent DNA helicase RuvA [marine bacterium B5-7]